MVHHRRLPVRDSGPKDHLINYQVPVRDNGHPTQTPAPGQGDNDGTARRAVRSTEGVALRGLPAVEGWDRLPGPGRAHYGRLHSISFGSFDAPTPADQPAEEPRS